MVGSVVARRHRVLSSKAKPEVFSSSRGTLSRVQRSHLVVQRRIMRFRSPCDLRSVPFRNE